MLRSRFPRLVLAGALAGALIPAAAAGAPSPETVAVVEDAVAFLDTSQQFVEDTYPNADCTLTDNGSFEVACFGGFETPDAVLAIAEAGQTGDTWSTAQALAAVEAVETDAGFTGLDAIDDMAESGSLGAGGAAKLIVLVVAPLGLDATDVDPSDDSADPVDLVDALEAGAQPDGSFGVFSDTLYAAMALHLLGETVAQETVDLIVAAQQADGGWNFGGDPAGTDVDPDTTGLAVQALVAAGFDATDDAIKAALAFFATHHKGTGAWPSPFDDGNPNSTARAIQGIVAAGYDPTTSCWRDVALPSAAGTLYTNPDAYLRGQQDEDGHIASPVDQFGVNTSGTSQAVQALLRLWLPVERVTTTCAVAAPPVAGPTDTTPATVAGSTAPTSTLVRTGPSSRTESEARIGVVFIGAGMIALALSVLAEHRRRTAP